MISIIIPTYNEQGHIGPTVQYLLRHGQSVVREVIVSDGGSQDNTLAEAEAAGAIAMRSLRKGRSAQMNEAARRASSPILYFLHADSLPPQSFATDILLAVAKGFVSGCYRLRFDHRHWFLQANCWFTRFNINAVRFGDQSLFVLRSVFDQTGGFCEKHIVLEDQEIIRRIRRHGRFKVMGGAVTTSARKYIENGIFKMRAIFFLIYAMYRLGYSQPRLVSTYRRLIRQDKI